MQVLEAKLAAITASSPMIKRTEIRQCRGSSRPSWADRAVSIRCWAAHSAQPTAQLLVAQRSSGFLPHIPEQLEADVQHGFPRLIHYAGGGRAPGAP